jgi:hypothetical protein
MSLTPTQKKRFREELASYCNIAEQYENRWHYSQRRPYTGLGAAPQTWHTDDCSSYVALAFYWAMHHTQTLVSDPLGMKYSGWGYTGTALNYLKAHKAPVGKYLRGDIAIYGEPWDTVHMTVCTQAGTGTSSRWSSHGSEGGPDERTLHYHPSTLTGVYRHPALL